MPTPTPRKKKRARRRPAEQAEALHEDATDPVTVPDEEEILEPESAELADTVETEVTPTEPEVLEEDAGAAEEAVGQEEPAPEPPVAKPPATAPVATTEAEIVPMDAHLRAICDYGEVTVAEFLDLVGAAPAEASQYKQYLDNYLAAGLVRRGWTASAARYSVTPEGRARLT